MSDGRFGCGRVIRVDTGGRSGGRTRFIGAVLEWVGDSPPSSEAIAERAILATGNAHVRLISFGGGALLGERPLAQDGIEPPTTVNSYWGDGYAVMRAERRFIDGDPPPVATSLRRVRLETMKGLRDLQPLATAPALEAVELIDMRHLQPQDLAPLAGLPHLKAVTPGLGSRRKNEAAAAMLDLPPVSGPFDRRQTVPGA